MDEAIKQRDLERKEELERRDQMWRDELKQRDQAYWKGHYKRFEEVSKVLEGRDKAIHDSLISKDKFGLDSLDSCNHYLKSMYYEQINIGKTMGSMAQRQAKLIKGNVEMLDWDMASFSSKKKIQPQKSPSLTTSLMSFSLLMIMLS